MNEVATDGKGIEGIVLTRRVVGLEIEHDIKIAHLGNLCVTSDDASHLIGKDGIAVVALPLFQVVRQGNADALCLEVVGGIDTSSVVEHDEAILLQFLGQTTPLALWRGAGGETVDSALILHQLLPPLNILVIDGE